MGNKVTANVMMLGIALQKSMIPISVGSVEKALTLNGASVKANLKALKWGRWLAYDPRYVLKISGYDETSIIKNDLDNAELDHLVDTFSEKLTSYQNANYAESYRKIMCAVSAQFGDTTITQKTAKALFRAMAIKDEYEVARLMLSSSFEESLKSKFGTSRPSGYYLAPPFLGFMKDVNGLPRKLRFGSWVRGVFLVLSKFKSLRGTSFDPFAYGHERKLEVKFKKALISKLADPKKLKLNSEKFETQLDSALKVKGYGHIKRASLEAAILALQ
jgi:indolepyruvate ferredoxin oxidoreductase